MKGLSFSSFMRPLASWAVMLTFFPLIATAKTRVVLVVSEGLGHELMTATRAYAEDPSLWNWSIDPDWHRLSLHSTPINTRSIPDGRSPEMSPGYQSLQAWNGSKTTVTDPASTPTGIPFQGYQWLIDQASDRNQALSALSSGIRSYNTSMNWMNNPSRNGAPVPEGQALIEWAKSKGLETGVLSDMPFTQTGPTILAGARSNTTDESMNTFQQVLRQASLNLFVAAGHPRYNEMGQALSDPRYHQVSQNDWQELRSRARNHAWDVVYGDENLLGIHSRPAPSFSKRLVILQFGDTTSTKAMTTDTSGSNRNLSTSVRFQLKLALEYLDRNPEGFLLIVHLGRLPYLIQSELHKETLEEVIVAFKLLQDCHDWLQQQGSWESDSLILASPYEFGLIWGADSSSYAFSQVTDRGKNRVPGYRINHVGPSASLSPMLVKGSLVSPLQHYVEGDDPVYGAYLHSAALSQAIRQLVPATPEAAPGSPSTQLPPTAPITP
jgi:alkaline phosphatase